MEKDMKLLCILSYFFIFSAFTFAGEKSKLINLPKPKTDSRVSVEAALNGRRSVRTYRNKPLSLAEISQILWAAYGVTENIDNVPSLRGGLKTAPSAGALYPLEIYLVVGSVTNLPSGIYKYLPSEHKLIKISKGDKRIALCRAALGQSMIKNAPASLVFSAVFERTTRKYGKRGRERYVCMDLGHSGQNVYLQAYSLGLGTCAVGAFNDAQVKKVIGMPKEEEPLYLMPLGVLK